MYRDSTLQFNSPELSEAIDHPVNEEGIFPITYDRCYITK